jgi:hypothetical protein
MTVERLPLNRSARDRRRDRLRDQQRREAELLARVNAEEDRLQAEAGRTEQAIARARAKVASRQQDLDAAVVALAEHCGTARAAVLLDRGEAELARLQRARRRTGRDEPA